MKTVQLICLLFITLVALGGCQSASSEKPADRSSGVVHGDGFGSMAVYSVQGRDSRGGYTAEMTVWRSARDATIQAERSVRQGKAKVRRYVGLGHETGSRIEIRFRPVLEKVEWGKADLPVPELPSHGESIQASGRVSSDGDTINVTLEMQHEDGKVSSKETWQRMRRSTAPPARTRTIRAEPGRWIPVTLPVGREAGLVEVRVPKASVPYGVFLPEGEKPPAGLIDVDDDRPLPLIGKAGTSGRPDTQTALQGAIWTHRFHDDDAAEEWVFWWRDDSLERPIDLDIDFRWIPRGWFPLLCDPYVNIDISPDVVGTGDDIHINVTARAFAGLDMFWWYGSGTGISSLDRAFIQSGGGATTRNHSWTIQIAEPGTYTFGANARDVLYPVPGEAHQASEGCGLAYDSVEVSDRLRKSYSVAFIVLAPPGTDQSSPEFQAALNRVNGIKAEFPGQFRRSTDDRGHVDVSYPTVVLTPTGEPYGTSDGWLMWEFVKSALVDDFYPVHPDDFDFLAIYETFPDTTIGSRHLTVQTKVAGFGITPFDNSSNWGSSGRLRGIGLISDATNLPDTYDFLGSKMHLLLHEVFGHQWGVFASRLDRPGSHFDTGIQSPNFTVLYGRPWRKVDDTNYTTADIQDPETGTHKVIFHPWMLYVAGMKLRDEVPETILDVDPDTAPTSRYDIVTTTGTSEVLTLQEVIDASGDRYDVP